jgi:Mechanosensitive ion channel, beta-domain
MYFQIGDEVRAGTHVGTVTDVGTVLIQVTTSEGMSRVVCPWELVRIGARSRGANSISWRGETRRGR